MVDTSICKKCVLGTIHDGPIKEAIWCRKFSSIENNDSTCDYKDVDAKFELNFGSGFKLYAKSLRRAKALVKEMGFDWSRARSTIPSQKELWNGKRSWYIDKPDIIRIVEIEEI